MICGILLITYSSYEKLWETKYKIAKSFHGPWGMPLKDDKLDGRDFYAAKTVSDGTHRYLVGWQSIRKGCTNKGRYVWGGNVVVHELVQRENGELGVKMPDSIRSSFKRMLPFVFLPHQGIWDRRDNIITGNSSDGFGWVELGSMAGVTLIDTVLKWDDSTQTVGIMFHTSGEKMENWCQLRLEVNRGRIVLDRSGKTEEDQFFEEERIIDFKGNCAKISILCSNDVIVAYVDDVSLCGRCYGFDMGNAGLFVEYGHVTVSDFERFKGAEDKIME